MRISIGCHTNNRATRIVGKPIKRWMVYPVDYSRGEEEVGSPALQVTLNGIVGEEVQRLLFRVGDAYLIVSDDEWERMIKDWLEHEDGSKDQAEQHLLDMKIEPEQIARHDVNVKVYEEMERQFQALRVFVDLDLTL